MWPGHGALTHGELDCDGGTPYSGHVHGKRKRPAGLALEGAMDGSAVLASWHAAAHRHHARTSAPAKGPNEFEPRCDMQERENGAIGNVLNSWHLAAQRYVTHLGHLGPAKGPDELELSSCEMNTELSMGPRSSGWGVGGVSNLHEATDRTIKLQQAASTGTEPAAEGGHARCQQIMDVGRPSQGMQHQGPHHAFHEVSHIQALTRARDAAFPLIGLAPLFPTAANNRSPQLLLTFYPLCPTGACSFCSLSPGRAGAGPGCPPRIRWHDAQHYDGSQQRKLCLEVGAAALGATGAVCAKLCSWACGRLCARCDALRCTCIPYHAHTLCVHTLYGGHGAAGREWRRLEPQGAATGCILDGISPRRE